jgi:CRISPR-associated protein Cmr3
MRLFIEPTEPLLFRTGRPFEAGQNNFAESMFPPTPETLQGAVRAAIASYWDPHKNIAAAFNDPNLTDLIGDRDRYGRFRITGISLGRYPKTERDKVERLFPSPAHIMQIEHGTDKHKDTHLLRLLPHLLDKDTQSNMPDEIHYYLKPQETLNDDEELKPVEGWFTETDLNRTLGTDDLNGIEIIKRSDIYQEEPRMGIGIQLGTKAAEEGYLFQMLLIRMNHKLEHKYTYGFVVDIALASLSSDDQPLSDEQIQQALNLPNSGWMILGGEQRAAHFRVLPSTSKNTAGLAREHTLLYLATPASFKTGWRSSQDIASQPITAAINRYDSIGGWKQNPGDAGGENKVMRRCVPAGSVYFFDKKITLTQPLTDDGMEIGYGITYEGEW